MAQRPRAARRRGRGLRDRRVSPLPRRALPRGRARPLPLGDPARGSYLRWLVWLADTFRPLWERIMAPFFFTTGSQAGVRAKGLDDLARVGEFLEAEGLEGRSWCLGERLQRRGHLPLHARRLAALQARTRDRRRCSAGPHARVRSAPGHRPCAATRRPRRAATALPPGIREAARSSMRPRSSSDRQRRSSAAVLIAVAIDTKPSPTKVEQERIDRRFGPTWTSRAPSPEADEQADAATGSRGAPFAVPSHVPRWTASGGPSSKWPRSSSE